MSKTVITAAITGAIHTPTMSPHLPITPKQIADEAVRAYEAGAAVAHIHVRNPETGMPAPTLELYEEVVTNVKSRCNMILCMTTGGAPGMTTEQRLSTVTRFKPELGSFNFGSLNFGLFGLVKKHDKWQFDWETQLLASTEENVFANTFKTMREFSAAFKECNSKPELEIYDVGMINNAAYMVSQGHLDSPVYVQFVMGILGGIPATLDNLVFLHRTAKDLLGDFNWSVCAAGRAQMPICTGSLVMGGNVRVGMEDSLYIDKGRLAKSNAEQVEKIVRIARELGIEPASPDEARQILGLKGLDQVNY